MHMCTQSKYVYCVIYCSPKFVVTMNQVDDKYKADTEQEVMSNEASDDLDGML